MRGSLKKGLLQTSAAAGALLIAVGAGNAQSETESGQQSQTMAQACLEDLRTVGAKMRDDGYWFSGYRTGWGWGGYGVGSAAPPPAAPAAADGAEPQPWGGATWDMSPGYQIRALYNAANVLGIRGDQEGCEAVLSELNDLYDGYVAELQEAGVEPGDVVTWRENQIAQAKPVSEIERRNIAVEDLMGTDVHNPANEYLGTVEDVVIDPESGNIAFVEVAYGGFLGIGENETLIPWKQIRATPGFDTLVLDTSAEDLENAPQVDASRVARRDDNEATAEVDQYWEARLN